MAFLLAVFLSSCDDAETKAAKLRMENEQQVLRERIVEQETRISELEEERREMALSVKEKTEGLMVEIRKRLTAIESDHAKAVELKGKIEDGIAAVKRAEEEFSREVADAVGKSQKFLQIMNSTDPMWAFTDGETWAQEMIAVFVESQDRIVELESEIKQLRKEEKAESK